MNLGNKIKQLRLEKNMTLEELGNKVGVGKSTVRKWETGMIENMRRDKIIKIAEALGCTVAYLLGLEENGTKTIYHSFEDTDGHILSFRDETSNIFEESSYYLNDETRKIAQEVFEHKELRMLMDEARDASPEDIQTIHSMLLALKRKERGTIG